MLFKSYPFRPSSIEDSAVKDLEFIESFTASAENTYNVFPLSGSLITLLKGMLHHDNTQRFTID